MGRHIDHATSIAVYQIKGGTGRTTLATNLACGLNARLIDASDVKSSTAQYWRTARDGQQLKTPDVVTVRNESSFKRAFAKSRGRIVIDLSVRNKKFVQSVLAYSDLVLVPVTPSYVDVWSAERLFEQYSIGRRARLVWNKVRPRVSSEADLMRGIRRVGSWEFLDSVLHLRVAYRQALASGLSVLEPGSNARGAKDEILHLIADMKSVLPLLRSR